MSDSSKRRLLGTSPPELVVYDEPGECSYLEGEIWRLPLRLPVRMLSRKEFGSRLRRGDRRQGRLLYRTNCPSCVACEPIRLDATTFRPNKTQRRVFRKGEETIRMEVGPIGVSADRLYLYNLHKHGRALSLEQSEGTEETYRSFLGESCCDTFEMRYYVDDQLLGVAILDRADDALSAVYFYWDPQFAAQSPGVYSVLKQVEMCKRLGVRYLYLGLYIEQCAAMCYKARYLPHERLISGSWQPIARAAPHATA